MNTLSKEPFEDDLKNKYKFAGFWIRFGASLIDSLVLIPLFGLVSYNITNLKSLVVAIILLLIGSSYKPLMETYCSATVGKMAVNIKVVDLEFNDISWKHALKRWFPWSISSIISLVFIMLTFSDPGFEEVTNFISFGQYQREQGYDLYQHLANLIIYIPVLTLLFSKTKQGLHDKFAGTYCIYK